MFFHVLSPSVLIIALAFIASVQAAPVASCESFVPIQLRGSVLTSDSTLKADAPCVLGAPYVCTRDVASSVDAPESAEGSASGREGTRYVSAFRLNSQCEPSEITMPFMLWTPIPRPNATRRDDGESVLHHFFQRLLTSTQSKCRSATLS